MRRTIYLYLLTIVYTVAAQGVWVKEGENETAVGNEYFTLYLSKGKGWLMDRLEDKKGVVILSDFHIYTDWGIYPKGYIGSKEEKEGRLKIERMKDALIAVGEGELKAGGVKMDEPIRYIVKYKVGREALLGVDVELKFEGSPRKVSAFLAQVFAIPSAKQWLVNSFDGLISEDMGNVVDRCWQSRDEPLSLEEPFIWILTQWGKLRIEKIYSQPQAQNIFLFDGGNGNLVFFFGFMDGSPQEFQTFKASYIIRL